MKILLSGLAVLFLLCSGAQASTLTEEKAKLRNDALEAMVAELGLRESNTASRDLPGWRKTEKVVVWAVHQRSYR